MASELVLMDGARVCARGGAYREALELLGKALRHAPRSPAVWFEIGAVLAAQGEHEEAVEAFEHVLDLQPVHARAQFHKGLLLAQLGRTDEAVVSLAASVDLDPELREAVKEALAVRPGGKMEISIVS
jgi:tetratricopeptide (TPR) repeat protein